MIPPRTRDAHAQGDGIPIPFLYAAFLRLPTCGEVFTSFATSFVARISYILNRIGARRISFEASVRPDGTAFPWGKVGCELGPSPCSTLRPLFRLLLAVCALTIRSTLYARSSDRAGLLAHAASRGAQRVCRQWRVRFVPRRETGFAEADADGREFHARRRF